MFLDSGSILMKSSMIPNPLGPLDISAWLAFASVMLLLANMVLMHMGPDKGVLIDRGRFRLLAIIGVVMLLVALILRVYSIVQ